MTPPNEPVYSISNSKRIFYGLSIYARVAPGGTITDTFTIWKNVSPTNPLAGSATSLSISLTGSELQKQLLNVSEGFKLNDKFGLRYTSTNSNASNLNDFVIDLSYY